MMQGKDDGILERGVAIALDVPGSSRRLELALLLSLVGASEEDEVETSKHARHDSEG